MCLFIKRGEEPKIAKQDIICFKIMQYYNHVYIPPYYGRFGDISLYIINGKEDYMADNQECHSDVLRHGHSEREDAICEGYIHTFATARGVISEYENFLCVIRPTSVYKIFKCIIPKGTEYYLGNYESDSAYASRKIRFVEEIDTKEIIKMARKERENLK